VTWSPSNANFSRHSPQIGRLSFFLLLEDRKRISVPIIPAIVAHWLSFFRLDRRARHSFSLFVLQLSPLSVCESSGAFSPRSSLALADVRAPY